MTDLPEKINAATFQISFADGDRIGATNMYLGSIANNIPAVYFLEEKNIEPDNDLTYWYNFGLRHNNPYILRVYAKSDYLLPGGKEMELLFTEVIECTLKDWAKKNLLLHSPNSKRLSAPFINILLDILHGLIYFRINLRRPHSWITSDNIYIVRGRAKLANVVNNEKYNIRSFTHDVQSFRSIVDELFKTNGEEIPLELLQLFLLNSVHHPVLLSTKQRGELRHSAFSIINEFTFSYKSIIDGCLQGEFYDAMRKFPCIQGFSWIENVKEPEFINVLYFKQPPIQAPPQPSYSDKLIEFLRYSRNVGEHIQDKYKRRLPDDIIDERLTSYLPGFLPILHDVFNIENIFVSPLPIIK